MAYYGKPASNCPNHLAFKNAQNLAMAAPTSGTNASKIGVWSHSLPCNKSDRSGQQQHRLNLILFPIREISFVAIAVDMERLLQLNR